MTTLIDAQAAIRTIHPRPKACRVHRFGGPEVITLEDLDVPQPGDDDVVIRVKAAGVGPWDAWIRAGKSVLPQPLPLTLGSDLAGVVHAIGRNVSAFKPGDNVFGVTNPRFVGAYADYALASAGMIAKSPARLASIDAASVPVVAVTAWQALFEQAEVKPGQTVLIQGAAGNVGAYAVQFAHQAGIRVIATTGTQDLGYIRTLGADVVIDHRATRFEDEAGQIDAVIDLVGGDAQSRSFSVLKRDGVLVSAVSQPDQDLAAQHGVRAMFFLVNVTTVLLERIARMFDAGQLVANVGTILPLASARTAHEMIEGIRAHPRGKIVLRVEA